VVECEVDVPELVLDLEDVLLVLVPEATETEDALVEVPSVLEVELAEVAEPDVEEPEELPAAVLEPEAEPPDLAGRPAPPT